MYAVCAVPFISHRQSVFGASFTRRKVSFVQKHINIRKYRLVLELNYVLRNGVVFFKTRHQSDSAKGKL